jgi:hypothetical protein
MMSARAYLREHDASRVASIEIPSEAAVVE